jgi:hypothetical protein
LDPKWGSGQRQDEGEEGTDANEERNESVGVYFSDQAEQRNNNPEDSGHDSKYMSRW